MISGKWKTLLLKQELVPESLKPSVDTHALMSSCRVVHLGPQVHLRLLLLYNCH